MNSLSLANVGALGLHSVMAAARNTCHKNHPSMVIDVFKFDLKCKKKICASRSPHEIGTIPSKP